MTEEAIYWDGVWKKRTHDDDPMSVDMNIEKMRFLMRSLIARPYYKDMWKLDVGCGTGIHAVHLEKELPGWKRKYLGIDLSEVAVAKAREFNVNAYVADFYTLELDRKVEAFLFLDSLEHFADHRMVIHSINALAAPNYYVFGNIPLYQTTSHGDNGYEQPVDRQTLVNLFGALGFTSFWQRIYGSYGYPYMVFEARKYGKIGDEYTGNIGTS